MTDEINAQAEIFFRENGIFVMPVHLAQSGEPYCGLPVIDLPTDVDAKSLGEAVFLAFDENENEVPNLSPEEHEALLEKLAHEAEAASWDEFEAGARCCTVWTDDVHLVIQKLERDPDGGFAYVEGATDRFPCDAAELGRRLIALAPTL